MYSIILLYMMVSFVLEVSIGTFALHIAAKGVKIENATVKKAFTVAVITASAAACLFFWWATLSVGGFISFLHYVAWIFAVVVIAFIYSTTWTKVITTWIFYVIALWWTSWLASRMIWYLFSL